MAMLVITRWYVPNGMATPQADGVLWTWVEACTQDPGPAAALSSPKITWDLCMLIIVNPLFIWFKWCVEVLIHLYIKKKKHVQSFFRLLIHMNTTLTSPLFFGGFVCGHILLVHSISLCSSRYPGSSGRRRCHSWPSGWRSCCFWRGPSGASCRSRLLWKYGKIGKSEGWLMGKSSRHEGLIWEHLFLNGGAIPNRP